MRYVESTEFCYFGFVFILLLGPEGLQPKSDTSVQ